MDPNPDTPAAQPSPGLFRYVLGFLLVGAAWGLTTPFMRRAAVSSSSSSTPESRAWLEHPNTPWLKAKVWVVLYGVWDVLRNPAYAFPFLINVTGSVWFFLLIGQAELSLTVPITNSLAFLFTVLGEWWAEKKVITKDSDSTYQLPPAVPDNSFRSRCRRRSSSNLDEALPLGDDVLTGQPAERLSDLLARRRRQRERQSRAGPLNVTSGSTPGCARRNAPVRSAAPARVQT
ncbi:hypothetical protein KCU93_g4868, partial [Aureobasidium melanogenum]